MDLSNCTAKTIFVDGYRFTRDERTGYYRCNKLRKRLHQYLWVKYNGRPQPEEYDVHHRDHDKKNNSPDNLILSKRGPHQKYHGNITAQDVDWLERQRKHLTENAVPKAVEWHRSEEGRKWHKEHYENMKDALYKTHSLNCGYCKETFFGVPGKDRFCSNKCKSAWRRASGVDDEKRNCPHCKEEFVVNKYSKQRFCSKRCSCLAIPRNPHVREKMGIGRREVRRGSV